MEEGFRDAGHIPQPGPSGPVTGSRLYSFQRPMTIRLSKSSALPVKVQQVQGGETLPEQPLEAPAVTETPATQPVRQN